MVNLSDNKEIHPRVKERFKSFNNVIFLGLICGHLEIPFEFYAACALHVISKNHISRSLAKKSPPSTAKGAPRTRLTQA